MANNNDWRRIANGNGLPSEGYCDQPYVVVTPDGAWLCTMTTGSGEEGDTGQHVVSMRSTDCGKTWSAPVDIEPPGPPEASWVMPLKTDSGRVYAFYVYNKDNMRSVIAGTEYARRRVDTLGAYMFKYSDDGGRTWSQQRFEVPVREFDIDRRNPYGGKVRFFWGVGKPITHNGTVHIGMSKVGRFGEGFLATSEGFFLSSKNILTQSDPAKIVWETLPDGDTGLRAPGGPIAEEQNATFLSDGKLYCTYRTTQGRICHAYSSDGGHTWTPPQYATYANGRPIKHPRAANFVRRFSNGKYLLWHHNHGGKWYDDRNPAWLSGGIERDGRILWSQPEIALYDDEPESRMSYPDFIEDDGRIFITETQKTIARVHEIDRRLLDALWHQRETAEAARDGVILELHGDACTAGSTADALKLPHLSRRESFSIEFVITLDSLAGGQIIVDTRNDAGAGVCLATTNRNTIEISLNDSRTQCAWDCDPGTIREGVKHHIVVIVDGGPKIISFVVDGVLCDGGDVRQFGWGRFNRDLRTPDGREKLRIAPNLNDKIHLLRIYGRYLLTSEAIGNFRNAG